MSGLAPNKSVSDHAEDSAFTNGQFLNGMGIVRKDTPTAQGADGDWVPPLANADGKLYTDGQITDLLGMTALGPQTPENSLSVVSPVIRTSIASGGGTGNRGDMEASATIDTGYSAVEAADLNYTVFASGMHYLFPMSGFDGFAGGLRHNMGSGVVLDVEVYAWIFGSNSDADQKLIATGQVTNGGDGTQFATNRGFNSSDEIVLLPMFPMYGLVFKVTLNSGSPSSGGLTFTATRGAGFGTGATSDDIRDLETRLSAIQAVVENRAIGHTPTGSMQRIPSSGTGIASAQSFTSNANATRALIQAFNQDVYYTLDGTTASSTNGLLLKSGERPQEVPVGGGVAISVIEATAGAVATLQYVS